MGERVAKLYMKTHELNDFDVYLIAGMKCSLEKNFFFLPVFKGGEMG